MHKVPQRDTKEDCRISIKDAEEKASISTPSKDSNEIQAVLQMQGDTPEGETSTPNVIDQNPQRQEDTKMGWIRFLIERAKEGAPSTSEREGVMHRVPQHLRTMAKCEEFYKPSVVSIGPYHGGDNRLQEVQRLKPKIAKQFHQKETEEDLHDFFTLFEGKIKNCLSANPYSNIEERIDEALFTQMMFLDGCFILGFMACFANDQFKKTGMTSNLIKSVEKDLFLLENQLPSQVLQVLIQLENKGEISFSWNYVFGQFIDWKNNFLFSNNRYGSPAEINSYDHLLHIQRARLLGKRSRHIDIGLPVFHKATDKIPSFRGVKELTESGIKLRPNKTGYIKDVNFWTYGILGGLTLPHMTIDNSTRKMFLNMIAYEACSNEFWFTSYICFLDLLIDCDEDVKQLRSAGILDNRLGSDHEVTKLFNEIAADLGQENDTYGYIKGGIRLHFSFRRKMWRVLWLLEGIRDHFKNPWTTFAVLGGFVAIFLTAVQTYYTVYRGKS